jgi:hypothetical protein
VLFQLVFRLADEAAVALQRETSPDTKRGVPDKNIAYGRRGRASHLLRLA